MRKKHFLALILVFCLLVIFNLAGLFSFLNNWSFDQLVKVGPKRGISPDIVAIRVRPNDDLDALIERVQEVEFKTLTLLMLNSSGTLTSQIFSADGDILQFNSTVQPPASLTWRGPENAPLLQHKLSAICLEEIQLANKTYLDFAFRDKEIPQLEAHQVVSGQIETDHFKDKIVIIGDHFASQTRFYSSPTHQGDQSLTALSKEILLIDTALQNSWVRLLPNSFVFCLAILMVAGLVIGFKLKPFMRFKRLTLALLAVVCLLTIVLLKLTHIWMPPASLLFTLGSSGLILYLASYRDWTQTLHKLVKNFDQEPNALLVYGPKGLLKYHSTATEELFVELDLVPQETTISSLLDTFTDLSTAEINTITERVSEGERTDLLATIADELLNLSIQPLTNDSANTEYLVRIDQTNSERSHHQRPAEPKQVQQTKENA